MSRACASLPWGSDSQEAVTSLPAAAEGVNAEDAAPGEALFSLAALKHRGSAAAAAEAPVPEEAELDEMEVSVQKQTLCSFALLMNIV